MSPTSEAQRLESLSRANGIRTAKKELKERLRNGEITLRGLLLSDDPPPGFESMRCEELLLCVPRIGRRKATRILIRANIRSPSRKFSSISATTRRHILRAAVEAAPTLPGGAQGA